MWPALVNGYRRPMFARPVTPPTPLRTGWFHLEVLGPVHNERDHAAWMSSIEHIRATPGFTPADPDAAHAWPVPMTLEQNLADLCEYQREFNAGEAFAYSVLDSTADTDAATVIGCVYIDPDPSGEADAMIRCWVRAEWASQDDALASALAQWVRTAWPFRSVRWPGRRSLEDATPPAEGTRSPLR